MAMNTRKQSRIPNVTMRDVARHAGVSQATVSYVLNKAAGQNIPSETQERILESVRMLGYRPHGAARLMATQRSKLIGFVTDEIATTPFAGAIIKGAHQAARRHGFNLMLFNTDGDPDIESEAVESLLVQRVTGIVYATMFHRPVTPPANLKEVPAVLLDCYCADGSLTSVVPDETGGGRAAVEVLLAKGHRRIGYISNVDSIPATHGRLQGYRDALEAHGIAYNPDLVVSGDSNARGGYDSTLALMQRPNRPTALFCFNDRMAMGAYDALRKLGLGIPDDVALIGFDNQDSLAEALHPGLSTMQLPHFEMGQWAINYLVAHSDEDAQVPVHELLPCPYVERESAG